jgi:exodeoxyribonuclease VII large subunit
MFPSDPLFGRPIYRVSQLLAEVSLAVSAGWKRVAVAGQACDVRPHRSGHVYFSLKDETGKLSAVMWRSDALRSRFRLEEGMEVVATGTLCIYAARGQFQMQVVSLEPIGVGAMQLAFEQTRRRLEAEGLFDPARKRLLPALPKRIGVVTSPDGAAIRDILTVLERRHPSLRITIYGARVQGEGAAREIADAIRSLNRVARFDVIIVTRGGGSAEDLAPFNDEELVRALAASAIPTISAVGHETDWTLCDSAADLRAPTPSAAAEIVVGVQEDITRRVALARRALFQMARRRIAELRGRVMQARGAESLVRFRFALMRRADRVDAASERLEETIGIRMERAASRLAGLAGKLGALDPAAILRRGYAIVFPEGSTIPMRSAAGVVAGAPVRIQLARGGLRATVTGVAEKTDGSQ